MFARTERLLLRPAWHDDSAALRRALDDEAVLRGLGRAIWARVPADIAASGTAAADPLRPMALAFARTFGAPRLIGGVAIEEGEDGRAPALSLWVARPYWGLGFATEAGRAMIAFARDGLRLPRLAAHAPEGALAASRVLAKLGFQRGATGHRLDLADKDAAMAA